MKIRVSYVMVAYIEADTFDKCNQIWESVPLNIDKDVKGGHFTAEYGEVLEVCDADTLEEIN